MRISDWSSDVCSSDLADDELLGRLGLVSGAAFGLAPGRHGVPAARGLALATAEGVVDRVHGDTAGLGLDALPAVAAGLADLDQLGLGVADLTEGGSARSEERRVGKECGSTCRSRWSR